MDSSVVHVHVQCTDVCSWNPCCTIIVILKSVCWMSARIGSLRCLCCYRRSTFKECWRVRISLSFSQFERISLNCGHNSVLILFVRNLWRCFEFKRTEQYHSGKHFWVVLIGEDLFPCPNLSAHQVRVTVELSVASWNRSLQHQKKPPLKEVPVFHSVPVLFSVWEACYLESKPGIDSSCVTFAPHCW